MIPSYQKFTSKELSARALAADQLLQPCRLCPRNCRVNRRQDEDGFCQLGENPIVNSHQAHFGEEACLVGKRGSGTIFFTSCNLACAYCQNPDTSHDRMGEEVTSVMLAKMMVDLQSRECHNINLVSPTIWVPAILRALVMAKKDGLSIPLVYNSGGYDSVDTLKILDGIIDIYLPDIKYTDSGVAKKYSLVDNYWPIARKAVREMHRQVGDLVIAKNGLAEKGLLVRHLVLPDNLAGTAKIMDFISSLSKNTYVNIMNQYQVMRQASAYPELDRPITAEEFKRALDIAKDKGLCRLNGTG